MDKREIDICCKYGFSVNLLVDNIECVIEDILYGDEVTEQQVGYIKTRINQLRQHEKPFKEMLDIKASEEKY